MMDETGCDFVMIGRAALGNPWLFTELKAAWQGESIPERPTFDEIADAIISHYKCMDKAKGEYVAVREMRKFIPRYIRGIPGSVGVRSLINTIESGSELCDVINKSLRMDI